MPFDPIEEADKESTRLFLNELLLLAIKHGAGQVHIEPKTGRVTLLFPTEVGDEPAKLVPAVMTRLKIMAEIPHDTTSPQEGEIQLSVEPLGGVFLNVQTTNEPTEKLRIIIAH
jgi:type II secretory ATPase GspE/PulE/Tfp pilus assembly ATPase PilB-like protein